MTHATKLAAVLLVALAPTLACRGEAQVDSNEEPAVARVGAPKIAADAPVYDFGAIGPTDSVEHVFTIRNAGDADLKIERVQKT